MIIINSHSADGGHLRCSFVSVRRVEEESHEEVAPRVEEEEGPVALGHVGVVVEDVIHHIDPHVAKVVKQIHWNCVPVFRQIVNVLLCNFGAERLVA